MNRSESYWNRYESEANRFAAMLLMPKELLETIGRKIIDAYKAEHGVAKMPLARFVNSMATRFGVSSPAMEYRLKSLGVGKRD
jgi:Zn-dependent peptidase ImmA (M78 family)